MLLSERVVLFRAAEDRCLEMDSLKPRPRYLFCRCETVVSMSEAGVSAASVTIAEDDFLSVVDAGGLGRSRTLSTFNGVLAKRPLMNAIEEPEGIEARWRVGFAALS